MVFKERFQFRQHLEILRATHGAFDADQGGKIEASTRESEHPMYPIVVVSVKFRPRSKVASSQANGSPGGAPLR